MSSTQPTRHPYECEQCNGPRTKTGVEGSFCSEDCYHRYRGQKLLANIETDHTTCGNCGTKVKEVEPPTDYALRRIDGYYSTTAVIGFEYRTKDADPHETSTVCGNCGNCTLHQPFPEIQARYLFEYTQGIIDALEDKREQERHDKDIDQRSLFDHLLETRDLALSLGRAID